ncbi:hypothetical protein AGDE_14421 [Angomonas deanei]|nr:hypothetical protein AGDE_14421 [Angomonas deanei]|eukprot:EPY20901.1 hypothetical protein AGDE_14421 [Angomonas deanei]
MSLLFLALGELAARTRHYLLATALLKVPYSVKELKENCKWNSCGKGSGEGHVVTAFFASLLYYLQEEEELSREEEQQQQGHMEDSGTAPFSSPTEETDDTTRGNMWDYINASQENREGGEDEEEADLELDEGELSASLFSWFHLHAALNVSQLLRRIAREHLEHPPRSPSTRRAIDAGVLPASYGHHISTENDDFSRNTTLPFVCCCRLF